MKIKHIILPIVLILSSFQTQSATIDFSTSFSLYNSGANTGTTGSSLSDNSQVSLNRSLSRFDSGLGELTDVSISFFSNWFHSTNAQAVDSSPESNSNDSWMNSTSTAQYSIQLLDPSNYIVNDNDTNSVLCNRSISYSGIIGCGYSDGTNSVFNGNLNLSGFTLADFIGTNPLDFLFLNIVTLTGSCDDNDSGDTCRAWSQSNWSGNLNVTYTYNEVIQAASTNAVPEPAALLLFLVGLLVLNMKCSRKIYRFQSLFGNAYPDALRLTTRSVAV